MSIDFSRLFWVIKGQLSSLMIQAHNTVTCCQVKYQLLQLHHFYMQSGDNIVIMSIMLFSDIITAY